VFRQVCHVPGLEFALTSKISDRLAGEEYETHSDRPRHFCHGSSLRVFRRDSPGSDCYSYDAPGDSPYNNSGTTSQDPERHGKLAVQSDI
jgi:hypothetical protein